MKSFSALCVLVLVFAFVSLAAGQEVKTVNGGMLNGKAVKLPRPVYPEAAKAANIEGAVAVDIEIDAQGNVISAVADMYDPRERRTQDGSKLDPVIADPLLREAAEAAAREAKFSPTLLNGQPVNVKGRVMYNFVTTSGTVTNSIARVDGTSAPDGKMPSPMPRAISGGVLNGKASSLPAPAYPAAARAVNAEGTVSVQVLVDEGGNVIAAAALSGHPLLRSAAEEAARAATFSPTRLSGEPVKVSGVITYNFVAGKKVDQ